MKDTEDDGCKNVISLKNRRNDLSKEVDEVMDKRNAMFDTFRDTNDKWYDYQRAFKARKKIQYNEMKVKEQ